MAEYAATDTASDNENPEAKAKAKEVAYFLNEIDAALKREKDFRKTGRNTIEIYEGKKKQYFSILYSNTETLLPALYSAVPRPVVQRRFKDEDPLGKLSAQAGQRVLEFLVDTNVEDYETFDEAVRAAVLDALLPGRGVTALKYEHDTQDVMPDGASEGAEPVPVRNWETICPDSVPWDRFLHGYAKKWSKVPWIAYELHLDKESAKRAGIPDEMLAKVQFTKGEHEEESADSTEKQDGEKNLGERETALFYQIWDKDGGRKVRYLCPQYKDDFCLVLDDPLGITGFFNCPKPIQFVEKTADLMPIALYTLYETQASEVNDLTRRICALVKQIKARGAYDTELGPDLKRILDSEEGDLIPADKSSSLAAEKGLDNAIWMWPVEKLIVVLRELYEAREAAKRVIYEVTGVSDIIRGSTVASETATAQQIKSQWGTLRLKRLQKEVQRYARDLLRMMMEIASKKFEERTFAQMTGLPFVSTEEFQATQAIAAAAQQAGLPLDEQTQAKLRMPVWGTVLELLRNDTQRAYRIDIETNSTVEPEATEDQKNIADVMNALAQYLNGVAPLVQSGSMPFEAAQAMMLAIVRRFRFGPEIEDYVKAMKPPTPPDQGDQQAEQERVKAEFALKQQEAQLKMQMEREKHQAEMAKSERETQLAERIALLEFDLKKREMEMKVREMDRKEQFASHQHSLKVAGLQAQVAAAHAMPKKKEGERANA